MIAPPAFNAQQLNDDAIAVPPVLLRQPEQGETELVFVLGLGLYLRLHVMLRREGLVVHHKRTYRLCIEQGLQVPTKKRCKLPRRDRVAPRVPERSKQRWSLDFISDQLADHRRFRVLNIVDDHSRFSPGQIVDLSIPGAPVARFLDDLALRGGLPEEIILDNGPEGTSKAMFDWSERTGVRLRFIAPGKPTDNAFIEAFNSKFRQDCLNTHWFMTLADAQSKVETWRRFYNEERPHSAIGGKVPITLANPDGDTSPPVVTEPGLSSSGWPKLRVQSTSRKIPEQTGPKRGGRSVIAA